MNNNKLGCTLNLKHPEAIAIAKRLAANSDAVVENFSTGTMEKLGLAYPDLVKQNPSLVYLSASAFGRTGAWCQYGGYHSMVNAFSGLAHITGYPGGPPRLLGAVLPDTIGGIYIMLALLLALYRRKTTGRGCFVDFAMLEGLLTLMPQPVIDYTLNGHEWERVGNRSQCNAPHGIYRCKGDDNWIALSVLSQRQWEVFCEIAGHPEWLADSRFVDEAGRIENQATLDDLIDNWSADHDVEHLAQALQAKGISAAPVLSVAQLLDDRHLRDRGFVVEIDHPEAGRRKTVGLPWKIGAVPACEYAPSPMMGQHNDYVFKEILGYSDAEIEDFAERKVIA